MTLLRSARAAAWPPMKRGPRRPSTCSRCSRLWIVVVPVWDFGHNVEGIAVTIRVAVSVVYGIDLAIQAQTL